MGGSLAGWPSFAVALLAMAATAYQGWLTREHNRLSVRPNVRFAAYMEGAGHRNGIYVENLGLGPAILSSLNVDVSGQSFDILKPGGQRAALKSMGAELLCFQDIAPEPDTVLKPGDPQPFMVLTNAPIQQACLPKILAALGYHAIRIHGTYKSAYDETFAVDQAIRIDLGALSEREITGNLKTPGVASSRP